MTKTYLSYINAGDLRPAGDPSRAIDDSKNYMGDVYVCFSSYNFFKKLDPSPGPKNSLERPVTQFATCTICAKNKTLN